MDKIHVEDVLEELYRLTREASNGTHGQRTMMLGANEAMNNAIKAINHLQSQLSSALAKVERVKKCGLIPWADNLGGTGLADWILKHNQAVQDAAQEGGEDEKR